jgi:hypothetical protein
MFERIFEWLRPASRFVQPAGLKHYRFANLTDGYEGYEVWRDDQCVVGSASFTLEDLTLQYLRTEAHERETEAAVAAKDPEALCRLGWHRTKNGGWVRFGAGKSDRLRVYRMGSVPFDYRCSTVWSHDNPVLICVACHKSIDGKKDEPGPKSSE